ncbi:MAG: phosphoribosylformylglycinamidine synthase subunit PurQ [Coriobacteriales bacterium]|jgi:phosphoribosylformylglycinamidine synthase|nr:phosphoribosylformylglycinamidine synthase subunit PurQ [Coriobacteriales bacterium]
MSDFRFGIVVFPGTNCEQDVAHAVRWLGHQAEYIWHQDTTVSQFDALVLPGGSSYGNYLRPGALAAASPIIAAISEYAAQGKPVLGISNGFQILTEAGLLPGALQQNASLTHICETLDFYVEKTVCQWLQLASGTMISLPVSHGFGSYYADAATLIQMESNGQIVLRDTQARIAAVCNEQGNVFGMMPHPERACEVLAANHPAGAGGTVFSTIVKHLEVVR